MKILVVYTLIGPKVWYQLLHDKAACLGRSCLFKDVSRIYVCFCRFIGVRLNTDRLLYLMFLTISSCALINISR